MGKQHHEIRPRPPQRLHRLPCRRDRRRGGDLPFDLRRLPDCGLRRGNARYPDGDRPCMPLAVGDQLLDQDRGRHEGRIGRRFQIGRNDREIGIGKGAPKQAKSMAELMIAQSRRIVTQCVHCRNHGMDHVLSHRSRPVAQRAALQEVSVVHKKGVRAFLARCVYQMRQIGKADPILRSIRVVIPTECMGMQIGRCQQSERCLQHGRQSTGNRWVTRQAGIAICKNHLTV